MQSSGRQRMWPATACALSRSPRTHIAGVPTAHLPLAKRQVANMTKLAPTRGAGAASQRSMPPQRPAARAAQSSEYQRVHAHHLRECTDLLQDFLANRLVDSDHTDRIAAGLVASEIERGN